jgi:hypothetical protein
MKISVLGDASPGFICPMMQGLARMLQELKCDTVLYPCGIRMLSRSQGLKKFVKRSLFQLYMSRLAGSDAIIVIQTLEDAFRTSLKVEALRELFPGIPVILYDMFYFPTIGLWGPWLEPLSPQIWGHGNHTCFGLGRYDWYLCISEQNRLPMPSGEQPCSRIGIHLDDGSLFPEQKNSFKALVDFEREAYPHERKIQLEALQETGTDYVVLRGQYSIAEIRAVYRSCSIYFPAHMESFGLPICELQASGCRILTPYSSWCDAHRLPETRELSPNFIVYDNNKSSLVRAIQELRKNTDYKEVVDCFRRYHGHFLTGDLNALQTVLDRISRGEITGRSHLDYGRLMAQVPLRPGD